MRSSRPHYVVKELERQVQYTSARGDLEPGARCPSFGASAPESGCAAWLDSQGQALAKLVDLQLDQVPNETDLFQAVFVGEASANGAEPGVKSP